MDVFGFLDGLFSAISAAFSGKQVDSTSEKTDSPPKSPLQVSSQTTQSDSYAARQRIKQARASKEKSHSFERDLR